MCAWTLLDEISPRGGFIPPETLVLAGFAGGAIIVGGAMLYYCRVSAGMKPPLGCDSSVNIRDRVTAGRRRCRTETRGGSARPRRGRCPPRPGEGEGAPSGFRTETLLRAGVEPHTPTLRTLRIRLEVDLSCFYF